MPRNRRKSRRRNRRRAMKRLFRTVRSLAKTAHAQSWKGDGDKSVHELEYTISNLAKDNIRSFVHFVQDKDRDGDAISEFDPRVGLAETKITQGSRVKLVYVRLQIQNDNDKPALLRWCNVFMNRNNFDRSPDWIRNGDNQATKLTTLQEDESTRFLIKHRKDIYLQPRQLRTVTLKFKPTRGRPTDIRSPMMIGTLLENYSMDTDVQVDVRALVVFKEWKGGSNVDYGVDSTE